MTQDFFSKILLHGRITSDSKAGWMIQVEGENRDNIRFLIVLWDPGANDGADYWVEKWDDIPIFLAEAGWTVQWDQADAL